MAERTASAGRSADSAEQASRQGTATTVRLRVLLIEAIPADAQLALHELQRAGIAFEARIVATEEGFLCELAAFAPEIIISDFSTPQFDGMAALALARKLAPDTPFIFISDATGAEFATRALQSGASDFVLKTSLRRRLVPAIERTLR